MNYSQKNDNKRSSMRVKFPDEESKFPWLPMLLDAYAIIDDGVAFAICKEEEKSGVKLACKKSCGNCCRTHRDIPLYPLELVGIYWFSAEKIVQPVRETLKKQLSIHREGNACPFLINSSCSIHPLRPVGCRQFNVFSEPCDEGEDPYFTRRDDVLTPIQDCTNRAFSVMLPFYGISDKDDKEQAIKKIIHTQVMNLQSFNWKKLVRIMEDLESGNH